MVGTGTLAEKIEACNLHATKKWGSPSVHRQHFSTAITYNILWSSSIVDLLEIGDKGQLILGNKGQLIFGDKGHAVLLLWQMIVLMRLARFTSSNDALFCTHARVNLKSNNLTILLIE